LEGGEVKVVVDANLVAALFLPLPYSVQAMEKMNIWEEDQVELLAPSLLEYEIGCVLRKASSMSMMDEEIALLTIKRFYALNIECLPPNLETHRLAFTWAARIGQSKAYDGYYLAVAELNQAEFWTADHRLANSTRSHKASWVRWIGEN
jgi:predicted nucleic acid-binding protein